MGRLARLLAITLLVLSACTPVPRTLYSLQDQMVSRVNGFGTIRFYADIPKADLPAMHDHFLPTVKHGHRPAYLALSGGGEGGAFGAGLLAGWSERGDRPAFDLVAGVSAGALIAPLAFVGPEGDAALVDFFTSGITNRLNKHKGFLAGLLGQSLFDSRTLRVLIDEFADQALLAKVAARHRQGARLLVVTTNLDAERSVVWDMEAIAASGRPDAMKLFGDVLEASASIPAFFPPVLIPVTGAGRSFEEMHVDGGAIRQIYFFPDAYLLSEDASLTTTRPDIYAIVNQELTPSFKLVKNRAVTGANGRFHLWRNPARWPRSVWLTISPGQTACAFGWPSSTVRSRTIPNCPSVRPICGRHSRWEENMVLKVNSKASLRRAWRFCPLRRLKTDAIHARLFVGTMPRRLPVIEAWRPASGRISAANLGNGRRGQLSITRPAKTNCRRSDR